MAGPEEFLRAFNDTGGTPGVSPDAPNSASADDPEWFNNKAAELGVNPCVLASLGPYEISTATSFYFTVQPDQLQEFVTTVFFSAEVVQALGEPARTLFHASRGRLRQFHKACVDLVQGLSSTPLQPLQANWPPPMPHWFARQRTLGWTCRPINSPTNSAE